MHPKLHELLDFWNRKRGGRRLPARRDFDIFELRPWLGHLHLVEVVEGGRDFVFVVFGSELAVGYGIELTGKTLAAVPPGARESTQRAFATACTTRAPLLIEDDPLVRSSIDRVESLILPLSADDRAVDRLLIGSAARARSRDLADEPAERRRAVRHGILSTARLRVGAHWQSCVVLDYSELGARLQLEAPAAGAVGVLIAFGSLPPRRARMVWQGGGRAGIEFAERLTARPDG